MMSITRMSRTLRTVFEKDAVELARQAGLRQRTMSFTQLAYLPVLGWWKQPQAGPSALARFAGSLDVTLEKQTVACHLTERSASWLLALLQRVVAQMVEQRHERIERSAQTHGKPINPLVWELAHWTLVVTNVPPPMLSFE